MSRENGGKKRVIFTDRPGRESSRTNQDGRLSSLEGSRLTARMQVVVVDGPCASGQPAARGSGEMAWNEIQITLLRASLHTAAPAHQSARRMRGKDGLGCEWAGL